MTTLTFKKRSSFEWFNTILEDIIKDSKVVGLIKRNRCYNYYVVDPKELNPGSACHNIQDARDAAKRRFG